MSILGKIANRIKDHTLSRLHAPRIAVTPLEGLVRLGSSYGGWTVKADADLNGGLVISCGLGEDASFDVEIANRYGARVVIVDPTPRALDHFQQMIGRVGQAAERPYAPGGKQPVDAYDLGKVQPEQITIEAKALWINDDPVRFFKPATAGHVSHSIKFVGNSADDYITVPSTTLAALVAALDNREIAVLKMDIEGAEADILDSIDTWGALPRQLLIEFDVLREPGPASRQTVERIDARLRAKGYVCGQAEGRNYMYVRQAR
ncbi:FkbM family methyltransferase [Zavarzinia sp. CC-PAN008]|uniref:FkbM family methyltransferase n=1 Tax=Zavarzinia sp. CC-PAN008 TaxID=3243332 RepID=UPI003F749B01